MVTLTVVMNCFLDPILIFGYGPVPGYGVAGAAYATVITQCIAAIIGTFVLTRGWFGITIGWRDLKPDWAFQKQAFMIGLPASLEQSTRGFNMLMMTFLVAGFGTATLAVYGIGTRIFGFIVIPGIGLGAATAALIGQCIGAGNRQRAIDAAKMSAQLSFAFVSCIGILVFIFADTIVAFFIPGDTDVIRESAYMVRLNALVFGVLSATQALAGAFRGAGDTKGAMLLAITSVWMVRFPLAYFLSAHTSLGAEGIWYAFPATNLFGLLFAIVWFTRTKWWDKKVTDIQRKREETTEEVASEPSAE